MLKVSELGPENSAMVLSLIKAYVTETSEVQLFIQSVDASGLLPSSASVSL